MFKVAMICSFILFPFSISVFLQDDLSPAQRERAAATLPVSHAARYSEQLTGEPDDHFQLVSVHCSQLALASWSSF